MSMSAGITLRPYQERAIRAIADRLVVDRRVLMVGPTGSGKTAIAAALIQRSPRWHRVLWLAHRTELIEQALLNLKPLGLSCGVCCAKYAKRHPDHVDEAAPCQIGSVQTIHRRGRLKNAPDLVVIDEAHRSMEDSYMAIARLLPDSLVLGLTATPFRLDG